jgi:hypothetical protein
VEVVSSNRLIKDGRTVRQFLVDTYAASHATKDGEGKKQPLLISNDDDEQDDDLQLKKGEPGAGQWGVEDSLRDIRKGPKYPTPFLKQLQVLTVRTFKQRRPAILSNAQLIVILAFAIISGIFWLRMDKTGTL